METMKKRARLASSAEEFVSQSWSSFADKLGPEEEASPQVRAWFGQLLAIMLPFVEDLDQLPAKSEFLFGFDPEAARANPDNAVILAEDSSRRVLCEFAARIRTHSDALSAEDFEAWMLEIKDITDVDGKSLLDPLRIALTGTHSGPELDKVIPLIEGGAALGLPVVCIQDRVEQFVGA